MKLERDARVVDSRLREHRLTRRAALAGAAGTLAAAPALAEEASRAKRDNLSPSALKVAFLVDDSSAVIDFAGPWEVFQRILIDGKAMCDLFLVAPKAGPVRTGGGFQVIADYGLADAPDPDILVMGAQGMQTEEGYRRKLDWIKAIEPRASVIMSVCTGSLTLAATGLLDGLTVTTHPVAYERMESEYPKVRLIRDARYIDHGKLVTTGGETAGIDGALRVADRLFGRPAAAAAVEYMQYESKAWLE